ncbi:MAG: phosphoribosylaminoimidazolesuccinocarboxamide synthase [Lentisphaeria bacterium]
MEKLLYEGKAKKVFACDDTDNCIIEYKDTATALNGLKKEDIKGKGLLNSTINNIVFDMLIKNGIPTHFIKTLSPLRILVKKVEIVPLEVIVRNTAAGHFSSRYGVKEGTLLKAPTLEYSFKNDALDDPLINDYQIIAIGLATKEELDIIADLAFKINDLMKSFFLKANLNLVDFKIEFGKYKGQILLADEISPDSCRLWDATTNKKLDKDRFRRDMGDVIEAYQEVARRLQTNG